MRAEREMCMKRDAGKEHQWREAIQGWSESGQSVREFCRHRGLKESLFYRWRRELKLRDREGSEGAGFMELVRASTPNGAGVRVRLGERIELVLERGFDRDALRAAVACLAAGGR